MSQTTFHTDPDEARLRVETVKGENAAWVILHGEGDIATLGDLEGALDKVELNGTKAVHIDVSELDFADVGTVRRLAVFAKRAKQTGHHIKTRGASSTLRMLATLLEVDDDLGLT